MDLGIAGEILRYHFCADVFNDQIRQSFLIHFEAAEIGCTMSKMLDPDDLLSISAGLAKIRIESVHSEPIDPGEVFQSLEAERVSGILPQTVTNSSMKYQISLKHPGYLEQINPDGTIKTGKFQGGVFIEM